MDPVNIYISTDRLDASEACNYRRHVMSRRHYDDTKCPETLHVCKPLQMRDEKNRDGVLSHIDEKSSKTKGRNDMVTMHIREARWRDPDCHDTILTRASRAV